MGKIIETARLDDGEILYLSKDNNIGGYSIVRGFSQASLSCGFSDAEQCQCGYDDVASCKRNVTKTLGYKPDWQAGYITDSQFTEERAGT